MQPRRKSLSSAKRGEAGLRVDDSDFLELNWPKSNVAHGSETKRREAALWLGLLLKQRIRLVLIGLKNTAETNNLVKNHKKAVKTSKN
ncbi:hypothetical protein Y032_0004g1957 [Ancylostoma ceylanicum]|uniref:Uncharacterized protein n=1 Tax=Ancylostoma ceylanicum TaxID=53326 RepID=A0A016VUW9_9BILA|nr:hypothetical protein Y032_0004g1957 [Ancylostoma ceylanicum]